MSYSHNEEKRQILGSPLSKFARLLLEKGADVNCQDEEGRTALSHACELGHLDVVKILVQFNADPDIADVWGNKTRLDLSKGLGTREHRRVISSGTCACGTAPPGGPGTEVSRSAAGRGAPEGLWHWPAPGGPESTYGPESP
uniref:Uncharacterized protein n=1 Tax=Hippocampus comes TaxID=109280 RepID=A0A3Q3E6W4_HIPCM